MIESKARGIQSIRQEYFGTGLCRWASTNAIDVSAVNGVEPVRSSTVVHANAHSSEAAEGARP